jgi:hypothetical protein
MPLIETMATVEATFLRIAVPTNEQLYRTCASLSGDSVIIKLYKPLWTRQTLDSRIL